MKKLRKIDEDSLQLYGLVEKATEKPMNQISNFEELECEKSLNVKSIKVNPLSANFTKWSNALRQFVGKFLTNCLSVFDHFVGLALKGLKEKLII